MNVAIFYDSSNARSLIGAATIMERWEASVLKDIKNANEAAINALIAGLTATYHRIYITTEVAAVHATGFVTTAQKTAMAAKLYTSGVDPQSDNEARSFDYYNSTLTSNYVISMWRDVFGSTITEPMIIHYIGDYQYYTTNVSGTASAGGATSLTDATKTWVIDAYIGKYVTIVNGTGRGQTRYISDNDATSVTVNRAWVTNPDNTSVYRIVTFPTNHNLNNYHTELFVKTYLYDLTSNDTKQDWHDMLNLNQNILTNGATTSSQDTDLLATYITKGKAISDYLNL